MAADIPGLARRLRAAREARGWSQRELARRSGMPGTNTVSRAEGGHDIYLSSALAFAVALGTGLTELAGPFKCEQCGDFPPAGFSCNECGTTGTEAPPDGQ